METKTVIKVGTNDIWIEWEEDSCGFLVGDQKNCCAFFMDDLRDLQDALEKFDSAHAAYVRDNAREMAFNPTAYMSCLASKEIQNVAYQKMKDLMKDAINASSDSKSDDDAQIDANEAKKRW